MTTFVQLHLLTVYSASNLNRDDSGRPKTVTFGGSERLRISSQSLKRAWRTSPVFRDRLSESMGTRTQRLGDLVAERLAAGGMEGDKAAKLARAIAECFGKLEDDKEKPHRIKQLAFVTPGELKRAYDLADKAVAADKAGKEVEPTAEKLLLKSDTAVDVAMFGRMLADNPDFNWEAAVQVAHALTTHAAPVEDDYYVAVDDLRDPSEPEGAGTAFIGVQEFGAGVFYLYLCIDTALLLKNLGGDDGLARDAVKALVESATTVAPRGKQASFASRARASFALAEVGQQQPRSLAAAFIRPVLPSDAGGDILAGSVKRLRTFGAALDQVYGPGAEGKAEFVVLPGSEVEGSLKAVCEFCAGAI